MINKPPPPTPSPPNNQGIGNKVFQLIMKRIFFCNWFFIAKCIGDYVLDFVLVNVLLAGCWLLAAFAFFFPFPIIPSQMALNHDLLQRLVMQNHNKNQWKWSNLWWFRRVVNKVSIPNELKPWFTSKTSDAKQQKKSMKMIQSLVIQGGLVMQNNSKINENDQIFGDSGG